MNAMVGHGVNRRRRPSRVAGVPDRILALDGVLNFRDLGGYRTADGSSVRWRRLFRSDDLAGLTTAGRLRELGIRTVVDLRHLDEVPGLGRVP
jgi:protein-tyrosine phosphatase